MGEKEGLTVLGFIIFLFGTVVGGFGAQMDFTYTGIYMKYFLTGSWMTAKNATVFACHRLRFEKEEL